MHVLTAIDPERFKKININRVVYICARYWGIIFIMYEIQGLYRRALIRILF